MADKHVIYAQDTTNHRLGVIDHGIRGADIPSSGDAGPPPLYDDLTLPADNDVRFHIVLTTFPASGTLRMENDSSFTWPDDGESVADGAYTATGQRYRNGTADGTPETITLTMGAAGAIAVTTGNDSAVMAGESIAPVEGDITVTTEADSATMAGEALVPVDAAFAVTTENDAASFAGAPELDPVEGAFSATTENDAAAFAGIVVVPVNAAFTATTGADTASFAGGIVVPVDGSFTVTTGNDTAIFVDVPPFSLTAPRRYSNNVQGFTTWRHR